MNIADKDIFIFKNVCKDPDYFLDYVKKNKCWETAFTDEDGNKKYILDLYNKSIEFDKENELLNCLSSKFIDNANIYLDQYRWLDNDDRIKKLIIDDITFIRCTHYEKNTYYHNHFDSSTQFQDLTCILYLNDDYQGGELNFIRQSLTIKPEKNSMIIFPSNFCFIHSSEKVSSDKYIIVSWFKL